MADSFTLVDIAKRLGIDVSTARRLVQRVGAQLGLAPTKGKQNVIYLTAEDAERLIAYYESQTNRTFAEGDSEPAFARFGFFYLIQLVPEALPNRIKVGYTDNVEKRLAEHRCSAPTAKLVKAWPCKRSWDYAAMDSITRESCALVLNEVYEGDVSAFVSRAEAFFAIMPAAEIEKELSEHSPLRMEDDAT
jgi:hypothetical protein